jgi:PHP family Zn ribbon phosphoesterase
MLRTLAADLHIHTVLSPCAEVEMIPPLIVQKALLRGLALIAVTDHNASGNVAAVARAAAGTGLSVLSGMELQTREEVHLLCLFDELDGCLAWEEEVQKRLPERENRPDHFGEQWLVDESGNWTRTEHRMLATSAAIGLEEAVKAVEVLGGLAIPAHVDRASFSLLANLGFVPRGLATPVLEVSPSFDPPTGFAVWPELRERMLVSNGDAHRLADIGGRTTLTVESCTVGEIRRAAASDGGRSIEVRWERRPMS